MVRNIVTLIIVAAIAIGAVVLLGETPFEDFLTNVL